MGADAALLGAAVLVWAAATAVVLYVRRTTLARLLPELPLDSTVVERRTLLWGGVFAVLGAAFTGFDIERGTLLLYCGGLTLFSLGWAVQDNRQWWNARWPIRSFDRALAKLYRAEVVSLWALVLAAYFAWFAGWALIGRIAVEALQG